MKETGLWGKSPSLPKSILSYLGPREGRARPGPLDGVMVTVTARGIELLPQAREALLQSTVLGVKMLTALCQLRLRRICPNHRRGLGYGPDTPPSSTRTR